MADTGATLQIVVSSATVIGAVGYIIHSLWTGYQVFKKDIYEKISEKVATKVCERWMQDEKEARQRVDQDVCDLKRRGRG